MEKPEEEKIRDLHKLWSNFLFEKNDEIKETRLQLFLFSYQFVNIDLLKYESFYTDVPPKLCTYLQNCVYRIIRSSIEKQNFDPDFEEEIDEEDIALNSAFSAVDIEQVDAKYDSTVLQLIDGPNDITAIISLRRFLTHGLGGHILQFLSSCNTETIIFKENIVTLLLNLFPNSHWENNENNRNLKISISLDDFINSVNLIEITSDNSFYAGNSHPSIKPRTYYSSSSSENIVDEVNKLLQNSILGKAQSVYLKRNFSDELETPSGEQTCMKATGSHDATINEESFAYDDVAFESFKNKVRSSDEISMILIDTLANFVREEIKCVVSKSSATIQCLKFAIDNFANIEQSNAFVAEYQNILRLKLLSLIVICLNNLCSCQANIMLYDLTVIFSQFLIFLKTCDLKENITCRDAIVLQCIYIIFALFHNVLIISSDQSNLKANIMEILTEDNVDFMSKAINDIRMRSHINDEGYKKKLVNVLQKVIISIKFFKYNKRKHKKKRKTRNNYVSVASRQIHCTGEVLPCVFERFLLSILRGSSTELQEIILSYFQRNKICCCLYNLDVMSEILTINCNMQMQKCVYNFMCYGVLKTIFLKNNCKICESKFKSVYFHEKLIQLYQKKYLVILHDSVTLHLFLEHLIKISRQLMHEILSKILMEILLPMFYTEIKKSVDCDLNIILECLNVIINYLTDARLTKIFFTENNLKYMEEIICVPELTAAVCDLILIGINSATQEDDENSVLSDELIKMQLNATEIVVQHINGCYGQMQLQPIVSATTRQDTTGIGGNKRSILNRNMSIGQVLHLASIIWSFNAELYKTSKLFRRSFQAKYTPISDLQGERRDNEEIARDCALFQLVYATLTRFLGKNHHPGTFNGFSSPFSDFQSSCAVNLSAYNLSLRDEHIKFDYLEQINSGTALAECVKVNEALFSERRYNVLDGDSSTHSFSDIISLSSSSHSEGGKSAFLEKLEANHNPIIFDIKQQCNSELRYSGDEGETRKQYDILSSGWQKINWILSSSYAFLFGGSEKIYELREQEEFKSDLSESNIKISEFLQKVQSPNCKNSLIRFFEFTLAAFIMENVDMGVKLSFWLHKLKDVILTYAAESEDHSADLLIRVLQSLLKVAETVYRPSLMHKSKQSYASSPTDLETETSYSTAQDSDTDYHSAMLGSNFCSETDFSENDTEECYITADEGYQADGELWDPSEAEDRVHDVWHPRSPSSIYRTQIAHDGLCKIIIEILIELSNKCIEDPDQWTYNLSQLVNRLFVIREFLGGSIFLLRGFATVLKNSNPKLKDLQQAILNLLTNLNTPEVLLAYFRILGHDDSPAEILVRYFNRICLNNLKLQPSAELVFPMQNDDSLTATCSPFVFNQIKQLRNHHKHHNLESPLTHAPCIIPISNKKLLDEKGVFVSTWVQVNSSTPSKISQTVDVHRNFKKSHLISLGSDQLLISLYITEKFTLLFEVTEPHNQIVCGDEKHNGYYATPRRQNSYTETPNSSKSKKKSMKRLAFFNMNAHERNKENIAINTTPRVAFNKTSPGVHSIIPHQCEGKTAEHVIDACYFEVKTFQLNKNKWTHLTFFCKFEKGQLHFYVKSDGACVSSFILPCNVTETTKTEDFQIVLVGQNRIKDTDYFVEYSISTVMLFHEHVFDLISPNLTALGPDCQDLTQCQVGNNVPNYGLLNYNTGDYNITFPDCEESIKTFKDNLLMCYTAHDPTNVIGFEKDTDDSIIGFSNGLIMTGAGPVAKRVATLQTSIFLCGGLSCLLFLFGKTVEKTSNGLIQAFSLDILLKVAKSDTMLYTEFVKKDYLDLIGYVIRTDKCAKDLVLLKTIVNNACSEPILAKRGDAIQIIESTVSCIVYPNFIVGIIKRYTDWRRLGSKESEVLNVVLTCIISLIQEKNPYQRFNSKQFIQAGLITEMINFCKVYIIESPNPIQISEETAKSFINILSSFNATTSLIDEIVKLLLLFQKPSECFVTHERSKFYFLILSKIPVKKKIISLPLKSPLRRTLSEQNSENFEATNAVSISDLNTRRDSGKYTSNFFKMKTASNARKFLEAAQNNSICSYKFDEFREIVDCSKINKNQLHLLNSKGIAKQSVSFSDKKKINRNIYQLNREKVGKISRRKINTMFTRGPNPEVEERRNKSKILSEIERQFVTLGEYDIVESEEIINAEDTQRNQLKKFKFFSKSDFHDFPGVIKLQEELFKLLRKFLLILPDNQVNEVLHHYMKIELLIVLSNNKSCAVRAAIVNLISAFCYRLQDNELQGFNKHFVWHHLANQLSLNMVDSKLFEACLQWTTKTFYTLEECLQQGKLTVTYQFGLNVLIAFLPQTVTNTWLTAKCFKIMTKLCLEEFSTYSYCMKNGIVESVIKTLHRLFNGMKPVPHCLEDAIIDLLVVIVEKSMKKFVEAKAFWDICNLLSATEEGDILSVIQGLRSIQAGVLLKLFEKFLLVTELNFGSVNIPAPRDKMFRTLKDKAVQFFVISSNSYKMTPNEISLFDYLILVELSGIANTIPLLTWGLLPHRSAIVKILVIDYLWKSCRNDSIASCFRGDDGKVLRSLLSMYLSKERMQGFEKTNVERIEYLCRKLSITKAKEVDATVITDKWDVKREQELVKQRNALEKTLQKYEYLAECCIESAMIITRTVTELQNSERKVLMEQMKAYDENFLYQEWVSLIRQMTHEGAPWYNEQNYPKSWELDDTEGPSRVRPRLSRCHLTVDPKFLLSDCNSGNKKNTQPLEYLLNSHDHYLSFSKNSHVLYNFPTVYLPVDGEIDGELLITDDKIYFVTTYCFRFYCLSYDIKSITEIWLRRYQHQERAFELFLDSNKSKFFALKNQEDFDAIKILFTDKIVQFPDQNKVFTLTQQWREGQLTNWEYLMTLNQISGRTYNDLMQYPVFPWILSDYSSEILDLKDSKNFRKLEKPIAVQHDENEMHYINNYAYISNTMGNMGSMHMKPYHYSSHYSNSGTVLHFLVRVPPYTGFFLRYQDNNFDLPDRTFHSINTTWRLASKESPTDVKELIPEFFCLPEMFENLEGFNFGCRQSGEIVNHVILPPWCSNNPRLFVLIHRQALESEIVRTHLHNWIDLIFGFKQTGLAAVEAINVFHPATYAEFHLGEISDPIERKAVETMIKTYGQMPRQLLKVPHPSSKQLHYSNSEIKVLPTVDGLRWGVFTGSPDLGDPEITSRHISSGLKRLSTLVSFNHTNVVYGVPEKCCFMQGPEVDVYLMVSWNYEDRLVRCQSLSESSSRSNSLLYDNPLDEISCAGSDINSNTIWFGHKSGRISVYQCYKSSKYQSHSLDSIKFSYNSAYRITRKAGHKSIGNKKDSHNESNSVRWLAPAVLIYHLDEVSSIALSSEFKIAVSGSKDGSAAIWDSNNFCFIRAINKSIEIQNLPISIVAISPTLGDIVTVHTIEKFKRENKYQDDECYEVTEESVDSFVNVCVNLSGKSMIRLHSINAKYIERAVCAERIVSVCYSFVKEGVGVNVIATALENGCIKFWSSWDLAYVKQINTNSNILSLAYSTYQYLIVLTEENSVEVWQSEGLQGKPPLFPRTAFNQLSFS